MQSGLDGKVVFITGASGGIGRALARSFFEEGALLALAAHSNVDALASLIEDEGWSERAMLIEADVRKPADLERAMDGILAAWHRVDACVANAGIWPPADLPLHELPESRVRDVIDTNLLGATWTAQAFLRAMAATGCRDDEHGASLVFIGSTAGRFGERDHVDYSMSKAGLHGLVQSLKNEICRLDPYGRVNMVQPGWTVTAMARPALEDPAVVKGVVRTMAMRQLARAMDIARSVVYLSSPLLARHVSGEIITVAGGMEGRTLWAEDQIDYAAIQERWQGRD